jgi:hypothetical protein
MGGLHSSSSSSGCMEVQGLGVLHSTNSSRRREPSSSTPLPPHQQLLSCALQTVQLRRNNQ